MGFRFTAFGCPLSTSRLPPVILSDSEGSRCLPLLTLMPINTSRREDIRPSGDRHQKTVFPKARGFRRLRRPGSRPRRGCAPGGLRFRPQSGLVQRGVLYAAFGGYKIAAKPPPQPFEPSEPCEPSEPGTRSGLMGAEPSEPGRGAAIII